jgi:hypothetical protein
VPAIATSYSFTMLIARLCVSFRDRRSLIEAIEVKNFRVFLQYRKLRAKDIALCPRIVKV